MLQLWVANRENRTLLDPAFSFRMSVDDVAGRLVMDYEYLSRTDSVAADRMPAYLQHLGQVADKLGFTVHWQ